MDAVLGVDIGTSSSKAVLSALDGRIIAIAVREHNVSRPSAGFVEMDPEIWWQEFCSMARELNGPHRIVAVAVSGMGPCVAVTDAAGVPLRPAILYGVDTRATAQIAKIEAVLGRAAILERCGSLLSSQSAGPKLAWLADNEQDTFDQSRRFFMPASWLAYRLTGEYVLDHHSASQCTPLYDTTTLQWHLPWAEPIVGKIQLPRLVWAPETVGEITSVASSQTGLPANVPVVSGTIDAWTEAVSVGATRPGDLMLMYGTTMFLIATVAEKATSQTLWGTVGAFEGTRNLAGGMATSGAILAWLCALFGSDYPTLELAATLSPTGANGLLTLPYFAGERTPIADPDARGVIAGLTLSHTRGDIYRSALEATAMGVRHNLEEIKLAGPSIDRIVAVGGGTRSELWLQIVSDATGLTQLIPKVTLGAAFGAAFLAASAVTQTEIAEWNPVERTIVPDPSQRAEYDELFSLYRAMYERTDDIVHALAAKQRRA